MTSLAISQLEKLKEHLVFPRFNVNKKTQNILLFIFSLRSIYTSIRYSNKHVRVRLLQSERGLYNWLTSSMFKHTTKKEKSTRKSSSSQCLEELNHPTINVWTKTKRNSLLCPHYPSKINRLQCFSATQLASLWHNNIHQLQNCYGRAATNNMMEGVSVR